MSTVPVLVAPFHPFPGGPLPPPLNRPSPQPRRRTTPQQGRALELLGHAIEYLVDSRLADCWETPGDAAAVHLLMVCSRAVFSDCEEIQPLRQRLHAAISRRLQWKPIGASAR